MSNQPPPPGRSSYSNNSSHIFSAFLPLSSYRCFCVFAAASSSPSSFMVSPPHTPASASSPAELPYTKSRLCATQVGALPLKSGERGAIRCGSDSGCEGDEDDDDDEEEEELLDEEDVVFVAGLGSASASG